MDKLKTSTLQMTPVASHTNWRQRSIFALNRNDQHDLHYTCPITVSKDDAEKIRELCIEFIKKVDTLAVPSVSEEALCLNLDWFRL